MRPRLLDLYCCAGGAGTGYARAGFDVVGIDIKNQPRYPYEFHQSDALEYLYDHAHEFDAIHASPPCQVYSVAGNLVKPGRQEIPFEIMPPVGYQDLLAPTRAALIEIGKPWIIENVPGAPMSDYITLCGSEFDLIAEDADGTILQLRRHRQFESSHPIHGAGGCRHRKGIRTASVFGYGGAMSAEFRDRGSSSYIPSDDVCASLLGVDWPMSKRELSESIPPAYTEFLGSQLLAQLIGEDAA